MSIVSFDSSLLLGFYQSQLSTSAALTSSASRSSSSSTSSTSSSKSSTTSATAKDVTPWSLLPASQQERDAKVLSLTKFIDTSKVPVLSQTTDAKTEQDNQKLFALYTAVNNLSYLATIAKRDGTTTGQMAGLDKRFQAGLDEIQSYIANTKFNNFTLQSAASSSTTTSTAKVANTTFGYTTGSLVKNADLQSALPGVTASSQFKISVTKSGVTSDVNIDLSQVSGTLTLDNIVKYVNTQLAADGYSTRLKRVLTQGTVDKPDKAYYGIEVDNAVNESLKFSSPQATPSLYVSATSGLTTATKDSAVDSQGRLLKLSNLSDPQGTFSVNTAPTSGTTTASSTVVDSNGDVYMVGNTTGDFGNQLNAGDQDVYLTKYDSQGQVIWTRMLGSAGTASGAQLALNPSGGVTVVGSTNVQLSPTSVDNGNVDTFVTQYDTNGNQKWTTQLQTLNKNQGNAVSVDSSGNVYIGGQTTGAIGKGQVKIGGSDAYVAKLDAKGKLVYEQQFGTTSNDSVAATALTGSGDLVVASVQNGHAIVSKYAGGDARTAPVWQMDMGDLQSGGTITGLTVSGDKVYVTGATQNAALTAGSATVAQASSGGIDAYVFAATDNGSSVAADTVTYIGTSAADKGGAVAVGNDGSVYVTGSTAGTFAGETRGADKTDNMFVASLNADGTTKWVHQYGGIDGQSVGTGIAIDPNGSSVLDALGLPNGTLAASNSVDLLSGTTLRAGDSFKVKISSTSDRTFTITIDKGETMQSLVTKLNSQLWGAGKASVVYGGGGSALKLEIASGVTATLISGPKDLDALSRLGLSPGTLTGVSSTATSKSTTSSTQQTFGLGLSSKLSISTTSGATQARGQLLTVLSAIQSAYQKTNTPTSTTTTVGNTTAKASSYTQAQASNYSLAASILGIA